MLFQITFTLLFLVYGFSYGQNTTNNTLAHRSINQQDGKLKHVTYDDDDDNDVDTKPKDCAAVYKNEKKEGREPTSGVHTIWLNKKKPVGVYCDMKTDGGGWTVIQRRGPYDEQENFYRSWAEYKEGFGKIKREFWLGNDYISTLTNQDTYNLRFDLEDFVNDRRYALYSSFRVEDESSQYRMTVQSYVGGTAGDSFTERHNGQKFSTKDRDNDIDARDCAKVFKGGWWYGGCHYANVNGLYLSGKHTSNADGIEWYTFHGFNYSLKKTEMKVRPYWFKP